MLPSDGELAAYMNDMYDEGDWGSYEACSTGSYAAGIQLTVRSLLGRICRRTMTIDRLYFHKYMM